MRRRLTAFLSARRVELLLFLLLWGSYAYFYQSAQHNGAARFDQTRAILELGVLHIDEFRYNTADVVRIERDGVAHIYPNKAPGTSFLGVAPFGLWMLALRPLGMAEWVYWHAVAYLTILTTVGLLSALAGVAMFALLRRLTGDPIASALAVIAVWLGTICFPFSTLFFSHQQAAAQLVLAFYFVFGVGQVANLPGVSSARNTSESENSRVDDLVEISSDEEKIEEKNGQVGNLPHSWQVGNLPHFKALAAGFLCGFTIATEYPTALLVALLCAYFGVRLVLMRAPARRRIGLGAAFAAGLAIGLAFLVGYNLAVFGQIRYVPYQKYAEEGLGANFPGHGAGYVGVAWRGWGNFLTVLKEITTRPQRGLLYIGLDGWRVYAMNPVLWLALPGLVWLFLRRATRLEAVLVALMTAAYLAFNASYGDSIVYWGGAWSVGPRHLIPLLPFLALPLVEGARRLWFLFYPLLLSSIFYMLLATAVEPRVPYEYPNPARDLFLEKYLQGQFGLNNQGLFDPMNRPLVGRSTAFNLGGLMGLPGQWQLVPLLLFWLMVGTALFWALEWGRLPTCPKRPCDQDDEREKEKEEEERREEKEREEGAEKRERSKPKAGRLPTCPTLVLALFVGAIAAGPPIHAMRLEQALTTGGGLEGRYFPNRNWAGEPAFLRKDSTLDFNWTLDPPFVGRVSVQWSGTIRLERPGAYVFSTVSDDGSFLAIGERVVVSNPGRPPRHYASGRIEIARAGAYPLRIRYFNDGGAARLRVLWRPPGAPAELLLPPDVLAPPGAGVEPK